MNTSEVLKNHNTLHFQEWEKNR